MLHINNFFYLILFLFSIFAIYYFLMLKGIYKDEVFVSSGKKIYVQKVEKEEERVKGLSNRWMMCKSCGMLFVFEKEQGLNFWMKDMRFDLDIIFLDENKKIVKIFENVEKDSYPKLYSAYAQYVLELNTGTSKKLDIKEGDVLNW